MNNIFSIPVDVTLQSIPANYTPPNDMQGVLEAVAKYTNYSSPISGPAIVVSSTGVETEPGTGQKVGADANGLWIWNVGPGFTYAPRPLSYYRGGWWNVYTGKPGEIRYYVGPSTNYFDGSGLGLADTGWEGWALCNGKNNTIDLANNFACPGYRYAAGVGWITNIGSVLDVPGGLGRNINQWPYGVGGGGYGPGMNMGWLATTDFNSGLRYSALTTSVQAITAGVDSQWGGWTRFQFGLWNFSSTNPPISTVTAPGWPSLNVNLTDKTHIQSVQFGKDPTKFWPGGRSSIYWVSPPDPLYDAGTWTFGIDQNAAMKNAYMSRIPPYIAVGLVQFVGYA